MTTVAPVPMRGYPRNRLTDRTDAHPVVVKTTQSRGFAISYEDAGAGPVILLIPGSTMSAADWRDAGYVDLLAGSHRVITVDPLGNGLSDKPRDPEAYRWPEVASDLVAVLDDASVDRAVVWGYSRGGELASVLATEFPDRVAGLILHDGSPLDVVKGSTPSASVAAMFGGDFGPIWKAYSFSDDDRRYDKEVNDIRALGAMAIGPSRSGRTVDLGRVGAPALVLEGGNDDPVEAGKAADAMGVDLQLLPGLNHLEAFSEVSAVMSLVTPFLEANGI